MRRLTNFEESIVRKIEKAGTITFEALIEDEYTEHVAYYYTPNANIQVKYNENIIAKSGFKTVEEFGKFLINRYKKIVAVGFLLELLEQNKLIYFYTASFGNNKSPCIGKRPTEEQYKARKPFLFKSNETINELLKLRFREINSTPALEVYVSKGCRTEEQKINDEQIKYNKDAIYQNEKSIRVAIESADAAFDSAQAAKKSARYALWAIGAGALFSLATLIYTAVHDNYKNSLEDKRYLKSQLDDNTFQAEFLNKLDKLSIDNSITDTTKHLQQ